MRKPLLALLLAFLGSCALTRTTENAPLAPQALDSLVPGTTTAQEVVARLGAPVEVVQLGKRSAYRYQYSQSKNTVLFLLVLALQNEDTRSDRAWVFFDENQVLTHVGSTLAGDQPEYALPWEDLHD
jgi:outer membrane protein assembly factor BamE (lipoprotein component of BamABCDE complex)